MTIKKKRLLSMDFGSKSIKCLVSRHKNGKIHIDDCFEIEMPEGGYEDGHLIEFDRILNEMIAPLKPYKKLDTAVTIESTEIIKRELTCPFIENEMHSFLNMEVESQMPFDLMRYDLQYKILETYKGENDLTYAKVLVCAVPKEMVANHFKLISALDLKPKVLDIHANVFEKMIPESEKETQTHVMVLNVGHHLTDVSFYKNGVFQFNRIIKQGGRAITHYSQKYLDIDSKAAEKRKMNFQLLFMQEAYEELKGDDDDRAILVLEIVDYFEALFVEIQKIIRYYQIKNNGVDIEALYVMGGVSMHHQFEALLQHHLEMPARRFEFDHLLETPLEACIKHLNVFVPAIALSIRVSNARK